MIVSVAVSKNGRDLAWQFFKDHWQEFMNRYQVTIKGKPLGTFCPFNFDIRSRLAEIGDNTAVESHACSIFRAVSFCRGW